MGDRFKNPFDGSRKRSVPIEHKSAKYKKCHKKIIDGVMTRGEWYDIQPWGRFMINKIIQEEE